MKWIVNGIKWIMLITGLLTCTMFYAAIAPQAALQGNFGQTLEGPVAAIVVRNWGVLIGLMGVMLIYGAFKPAVRSFAVTIAGLSKVVFIILVLTYGQEFLGHQAGIAVVTDAIEIVLFAVYLLAARGPRA